MCLIGVLHGALLAHSGSHCSLVWTMDGGIIRFVIPHLEMRACDWSKSRHVMVNKSR